MKSSFNTFVRYRSFKLDFVDAIYGSWFNLGNKSIGEEVKVICSIRAGNETVKKNPIILIYTQYSIVEIAISIWKAMLYDGQTT